MDKFWEHSGYALLWAIFWGWMDYVLYLILCKPGYENWIFWKFFYLVVIASACIVLWQAAKALSWAWVALQFRFVVDRPAPRSPEDREGRDKVSEYALSILKGYLDRLSGLRSKMNQYASERKKTEARETLKEVLVADKQLQRVMNVLRRLGWSFPDDLDELGEWIEKELQAYTLENVQKYSSQ